MPHGQRDWQADTEHVNEDVANQHCPGIRPRISIRVDRGISKYGSVHYEVNAEAVDQTGHDGVVNQERKFATYQVEEGGEDQSEEKVKK
jgi:hypothetical protein